MKIVRLLLVINLLVAGGHFRPALGGEVRPIAFLHALEDQGYGDMAVDYLNMLKRNDDLLEGTPRHLGLGNEQVFALRRRERV